MVAGTQMVSLEEMHGNPGVLIIDLFEQYARSLPPKHGRIARNIGEVFVEMTGRTRVGQLFQMKAADAQDPLDGIPDAEEGFLDVMQQLAGFAFKQRGLARMAEPPSSNYNIDKQTVCRPPLTHSLPILHQQLLLSPPLSYSRFQTLSRIMIATTLRFDHPSRLSPASACILPPSFHLHPQEKVNTRVKEEMMQAGDVRPLGEGSCSEGVRQQHPNSTPTHPTRHSPPATPHPPHPTHHAPPATPHPPRRCPTRPASTLLPLPRRRHPPRRTCGRCRSDNCLMTPSSGWRSTG